MSIWRKSIQWFRRHFIHKKHRLTGPKTIFRSSLHVVNMTWHLTWVRREQNSAGVKPDFTIFTMTMLVWTPSTSTSTIPWPLSSIAAASNRHTWLQEDVFLTRDTAIYSLGHRLHILTAVPRSTQPSTVRRTVNLVSAISSNNNKW